MISNQSRFTQRVRAFISSLPRDLQVGSPDTSNDTYFDDDMLPFDLYRGTRQNIERVADQINKSFHFGIYDGCAVLMRRLIEMLLILAFKNFSAEKEIRDEAGDYLTLSQIINKAINNKVIDLSRNAKEYLDPFREKGNLSAHNPFHNALRKDMELVQPKFRHLVEELFYKAGILK
jgi:hypothetical protein